MLRYTANLLLPVTASVAAWFTVPLSFWSDSKTAVLAALSVIVAAIMVRLARGLPFTNADHFEVHEIRETAAAIKKVMRALVALLVISLGAMFLVIFGGLASARLATLVSSTAVPYVEQATSGVLGGAVVYVLLRIFQVAQSDYSLVELQSKFMIRAVERRAAENIHPPLQEGEDRLPTSEGFGRLMQ